MMIHDKYIVKMNFPLLFTPGVASTKVKRHVTFGSNYIKCLLSLDRLESHISTG